MASLQSQGWTDQLLSSSGDLKIRSDGADSLSSTPERTQAIINDLVLKQVQQVRMMHLALGYVSIVMATWVILRVYWDSWRAHKLQPKAKSSLAFLYDLHVAELFPLILGYTVLFQEVIMVGLQSLSMDSILVPSCNATATIIFPAIFALAFMHLVFGFEMTIRALKRFRTTARIEFATPLCLLAFAALIILAAVPTRITPNVGRCFGDLLLRPLSNRRAGLAITTFLLFAFLTMAAVIGIQLSKYKRIDVNERVAASRMFYYLVASAILQAFILPFWIQAVNGMIDPDLTSSRVAEFVLFASGAFLAIIHLILRANSGRFALKPMETIWEPKRRLRLFGPNDLEVMNISAPLNLLNETFATYRSNEKDDDREARTRREQYVHSPSSLYRPSVRISRRISRTDIPLWPPMQRHRVSTIAEQSEVSPTSVGMRKSSADGYPADVKTDYLQLPAKTYTPPTRASPRLNHTQLPRLDTKIAPLAVQNKTFPKRKPEQIRKHSRSDSNDSVTVVSEAFEELCAPINQPRRPSASHHRHSSNDSSRTVQIGIRLSTQQVGSAHRDGASPPNVDPRTYENLPAPTPPQLPRPRTIRRSYSDSARGHHARQASDTRPPYLRAETDIRASNDLWSSTSGVNEDFRFSSVSVAQCGTAEVIRLNPINALNRSKSKRLYKAPSLRRSRSNSVHTWF